MDGFPIIPVVIGATLLCGFLHWLNDGDPDNYFGGDETTKSPEPPDDEAIRNVMSEMGKRSGEARRSNHHGCCNQCKCKNH